MKKLVGTMINNAHWKRGTPKLIIAMLTLVCFVTVFIFGGCNLPSSVNKWYDSLPTSISYKSDIVELRTDDKNVAKVTSENFACNFQIEVRADGQTITNPYVISYFEDGERVIVSGYDPENRFTPFTICGTANDLRESSKSSLTSPKFIITTIAIVAIVALISISFAEIGFIVTAGQMQKQIVKDFVGVYDNKPLLHISIREFVENYLKNQIKAGTKLASIMLTLVFLPGNVAKAVTQSMMEVIFEKVQDFVVKKVVEFIVDRIKEMAFQLETDWATSVTADSMFWVVLDFEKTDNSFEKIFCGYTLYSDDPRPIAPPIPTGGNANWNASNSEVQIVWDSMPNVDGYIVYRQSSESYYEYLANTTNTNYDDHDVLKGNSISYKLRSYRNNIGWSGYSNPITVNWDAISYVTSFTSDPGWATSDPSRFYWDSGQQAYFMNRININGGGNYAKKDVDVNMAARSFQLEWDIKPVSVDYASGLWFGLYDTDMYSNGENGSYVFVVFANEDRGHTVVMSAMGSDNVGQGDGSPGTSEQKWLPDTWYHVALSYDSSTRQLTAQVKNRDTGDSLRSLATTVSAFAPDMDRVGISDKRQGTYQAPGAQAQGYIDNIALYVY
jgi:hypothetical protein